MRQNLKETPYRGTNIFDIVNNATALKIIKEELHRLGREHDIKKLSDAIDAIVSSLGSKS